MKRRAIHNVIGLLVLGGMLTMPGGQVALAAPEANENPSVLSPSQGQIEPEEKVTIVTSFPVVRGQSGTSFEYDFEILYEGNEAKVFEIRVSPPEGWRSYVKRRYGADTPSLLAVRMEPGGQYSGILTAVLEPLPGVLPELGEYLLVLEVNSNSLEDRLELTAIVNDKPSIYELDLVTATGRLDARADAGEDNYVTLILTNSGNDVVEAIAFSGVKSDGWQLTFDPSKLESLAPGQSEQVIANIRPPRETIAGDYNVLVRSIGDSASDQLSMRIKVKTPTFWGWVSGGIIAAIVASIVIIFRRLGRR